VQEKKYYIIKGKLNQAFKANFKELKELVKAIKSTTNRADFTLYKLEKLINRALSNRLTKALKYIKAKFLNIGYIT
jgi:hypothetical protein